jgi:ribosomal protein S18 acetylase RimI-like enzyme
MTKHRDFAYVVKVRDVVVGAICCRREDGCLTSENIHRLKTTMDTVECNNIPSDIPSDRLYIMTLGTLAPYRRLGIASILLEKIIQTCNTTTTTSNTTAKISHIVLHVHLSNTDAIAFYKRHQFKIMGTDMGYYARNRLQPPDAFFLVREIALNESSIVI